MGVQPSHLSPEEAPQALAAKSAAPSLMLMQAPCPHLLLTCHSAFPWAPGTVTSDQLSMPTGSAQFKVQHGPPGSSQKEFQGPSDTHPP